MTGGGRRWPPLDGLRAVAVLSVLGYHLYEPHVLPSGYLGVDLFFVLSGFLITTGLVDEFDAGGGVVFGRFYVRRALRLLPAALAVVLVALGLALATLHGDLRHQTLVGLPWIVLYAGNWARAVGASSLGVLANLWSLAVEEQFYLLWPVVLVAFLSRRVARERLAAALVALAAVEVAYREVLFHTGVSVERLVNGIDTHSDGLLLGCALALL
ncbi:MAG TPA: acyltransferase, partial [Acidimicrobiales bacterium]|nr:acyltransferase [Acidimicrobiales bacterium]